MLSFDNHRPTQLASWTEILSAYQVEPAVAEAAFDRLRAQYAAGRRAYHNISHVQDVLDQVELLAAEAADPHAVRVAAWFHDAVYRAGADDNEEKSARLAGDMLAELALPAPLIAEVMRLIRLTAGYTLPTWEQAARDDANAHVLLDADLAGLSRPWDSFAALGQLLREEFAAVPEAEYMAGRRHFLTQLLARDRIYYTPQMFAAGEQQARNNIQRELSRAISPT